MCLDGLFEHAAVIFFIVVRERHFLNLGVVVGANDALRWDVLEEQTAGDHGVSFLPLIHTYSITVRQLLDLLTGFDDLVLPGERLDTLIHLLIEPEHGTTRYLHSVFLGPGSLFHLLLRYRHEPTGVGLFICANLPRHDTLCDVALLVLLAPPGHHHLVVEDFTASH